MLAARRAGDLSQGQLGARVGTSQNVISLIERGIVGSSQFVLPICRVLRIHPPTFFESDEIRAWVRLGRDLRGRDEALFRRALSMVESMVEALGER
jgi:transcriptional regulator with XRE-family HTH domain